MACTGGIAPYWTEDKTNQHPAFSDPYSAKYGAHDSYCGLAGSPYYRGIHPDSYARATFDPRSYYNRSYDCYASGALAGAFNGNFIDITSPATPFARQGDIMYGLQDDLCGGNLAGAVSSFQKSYIPALR